MTRAEFERLRDLPDKRIDRDVTFAPKKGAQPLFVLEPVEVQNSLGVDLVLGGNYNPVIQRLTLNFSVRGLGPICRFCLNGRIHPGVGRTHKHDLYEEGDPGNNLPHVTERADLLGMPLAEVWRTVCLQARIEHGGVFQLP
jgi:hypothetical protein